jgi:putative flippase GtrA
MKLTDTGSPCSPVDRIYWWRMSNNIRSQLKIFLIVGFISVSLDWGVYFFLFQVDNLNSTKSKALSYVVGTLFAFYLNGLFAFKSKLIPSRLLKHLILYGISLLVNALIFNTLESVSEMNSKTFSYFPLLGATFGSMTLNFLGMRFWVFKNHEEKHAHR